MEDLHPRGRDRERRRPAVRGQGQERAVEKGGEGQAGDRGTQEPEAPRRSRREEKGEAHESRCGAVARGEVQVGGKTAARAHQPRPRDRAVAQVGGEPAPERPPLQVRGLRLGHQADAMAGGPQPVAQLHVLHRGPAVGGIEAAGGEEGIAADRAAAGPEGRRFTARALVHEVVGEVLVEAGP